MTNTEDDGLLADYQVSGGSIIYDHIVPSGYQPPDSGDFLAEGAEAARATYRQITHDLAELRAEKERIQERINELVEAEQLWAPIVHRLDNGIPRRKTD